MKLKMQFLKQINRKYPDGGHFLWALGSQRFIFLIIHKQPSKKYKIRITATTQLAESDY